VDGSNLGAVVTAAPYSQSLNTTTLANGKHSLTAVAVDTSGNKATSAVDTITVNNTSGTTPPTVSISSPSSGAAVSGTITVTATASDKVGVASVQFEVDGSNLGAAVTAAPYSQSLNTTTLANGKHSLTAVAVDTSGNKATSAAVSITVNNTSTAPSPTLTVSITSPVAGATVSGTVTVAATATASDAITGVQFLLDGSNLGSNVTSSPYSISWDTTHTSNGTHVLSARATDQTGNTATSSTITVTVTQSTLGGIGWTQLPGTELKGPDNVSPCPPDGFDGYNPIPAGYLSNCQTVISAWNSAMADPSRDRLIIWGGGHNDYGGNEIYSLELSANPPTLIRLDPPSPPNTQPGVCVETLSDGRPNSRHTYDSLVYLPKQDAMWAFGGALNNCGFPGDGTWTLALSSVLASCAPNCSSTWTQQNPSHVPSPQVGNTTDYDPNTGLVWMATQYELDSYDPTANNFTLRASTSLSYFSTGVIDPVDEYFVILGGAGNGGAAQGITYWSLASGSTFTQNQPTPTNCGTALQQSYPGAQWDPIDKVIVIYPNAGNTLYLLNPTTWTCTTETWGSTQGVDYPQNSAQTETGYGLTFKHFAYFPNLDLYALCNDAPNNCWTLHRHAAN
jgi:hypothetical protein